MTNNHSKSGMTGFPGFERGPAVAIDERLIPAGWSAIDEDVLREARHLAGLSRSLQAKAPKAEAPRPEQAPAPASPRRFEPQPPPPSEAPAAGAPAAPARRPADADERLDKIDRSLQRIADVIDHRLEELARSPQRLPDIRIAPRVPVDRPANDETPTLPDNPVVAPVVDKAEKTQPVAEPLPAATPKDVSTPEEVLRPAAGRKRTGRWLLMSGFLLSIAGLAGLFGWTLADFGRAVGNLDLTGLSDAATRFLAWLGSLIG